VDKTFDGGISMAARRRSAILFFGLITVVSLGMAQAPATKKSTPPAAMKPAETKAKDKESGPLNLRDVLQLRSKMTPDDILGKALERGIDFEVTKPIYSQLSKLGFTPVQLENLKSAQGIEPLPPIVPGSQLLEDDATRDLFFKQIQEITGEAAKDITPVQTPHLTLWAPKNMQPAVLAELKKLDLLMETKFQEPIRSGLDKRTAHIVLLRNSAETLKWMNKHFDVMKVETDEPGGKDAYLKRYINGVMLDQVCILNLESFDLRRLPNNLGLYVGYMAMIQLSGYAAEAPIITGFANGIEGALVGVPDTPIVGREYGVEDRNPNGGGKPWLVIAKQRVVAGKLTPPAALLKMTTANMNIPEFVESWTLIEMLVRDRVKFGKLVYKLREEKDGLKAIESVYGWNEVRLFQEWQLYIGK
jgi:hypothetical protein